MSTVVVDFVTEEHLEQVVNVLVEVRQSEPNYPPSTDAGDERESLAAWLLNDRPLANWVAFDRGRVAGYIQVTKPHKYLTNISLGPDAGKWSTLPLAEIGKFFVDPANQRNGIGNLLFERAKKFTRTSKLTAVLAVVVTSEKALAFYHKHGMNLVATFQGVHGKNLVFADNLDGA